MQYVSTRGEAPTLDFVGALLEGLARDGGLYLPEQWPGLTADDIAGFAGQPYPAVATDILARFAGPSLPRSVLAGLIDDAYRTFHHPAVAPLTQVAPNTFLLELFHGPTLAFKDLAMQVLARLIDHALAATGQRATIVAATSGDTGGAAVHAFAGRERIDLVVLFPTGRISEVQRRMMTSWDAANVNALAVEGTFDDCQSIVKALFNDRGFRDRVRLSAINSINWARIAAQIVYYVTAAVSLGAPHRRVSFVVPTGNFGDVFAGYAAARMGLPVAGLGIATNVNDILVRALAGGLYEQHEVVPTSSPSMDIQVSSNFERLLFEASGRNSLSVKTAMNSLAQSRQFTMPAPVLSNIRESFAAARADEVETAATMRTVRTDTGHLIDPHTAVALSVARKLRTHADVPQVVLSTAHPAKFPDAVEAACGVRPALPEWLSDLATRPERFRTLPADVAAVKQFVLGVSRAVHPGAAA